MGFRVFRALLAPLVWLFGRPLVIGREHLPRTGPVILAANHLSFCDSLFVILAARRRVVFLAKAEYFTGGGPLGALQRRFFLWAGQIPIERGNPAAGAAAVRAAVEILRTGGAWGIFPEGTRSPDGRLYRGRTGAIRVALETGAPVIPVVLRGTDRVNPKGRLLWRPGRVRVEFCPVLDLRTEGGRGDERLRARDLTDRLMSVLAERGGQEYVPQYARSRGVPGA